MYLEDYISLQTLGVRNHEQDTARRGGAGPSDARAFIINGCPVMIPVLSKTTGTSPYALDGQAPSLRLLKDNRDMGAIEAVPRPRFYDYTTSDGIPYSKIALLHGRDCLASTVVQECIRYNNPKTRCRFCAIGASLKHGSTIHTKTPQQLAEVAAKAKELDGVTHVTLTSGTTSAPDGGVLYVGECARAIKEATGLSVEIQFEPLQDVSLYTRLRDMGVDDVGLHIESFDENVRRRMTPGKADISVEQYFEAFRHAVAAFGRNKVSTYVILGMGEDEQTTIDGCRRAIELGVYPLVVPLRPLLDSYLSNIAPDDAGYLERVYQAVGTMLRENGLTAEGSTAGCVRCRACSLLQFTEQTSADCLNVSDRESDLEIRQAVSAAEKEAYYAIRRQVFVQEQGLFRDTDLDRFDRGAIVLVAVRDGRVVGGVRCYRHHDDVWHGGRLVVHPEARNADGIGALLVRKAVETMEQHPEVRRFLAVIQRQNVRFFRRLGWQQLGRKFQQHGHPHHMMEKQLTGRVHGYLGQVH